MPYDDGLELAKFPYELLPLKDQLQCQVVECTRGATYFIDKKVEPFFGYRRFFCGSHIESNYRKFLPINEDIKQFIFVSPNENLTLLDSFGRRIGFENEYRDRYLFYYHWRMNFEDPREDLLSIGSRKVSYYARVFKDIELRNERNPVIQSVIDSEVSKSTVDIPQKLRKEKITIEKEEIKEEIIVNHKECTICFDRKVETVLVPCGHAFACKICSIKIKEEKGKCSICNVEMKDVIPFYY